MGAGFREKWKLTSTFRLLTFIQRGLTRRAMPSKQPSVYSPIWARVGWPRVTIIYIANAIVQLLARAAFEKARQRLPNDSDVLFALSIVDRSQGQPDNALALQREALQLNPRNASLFFQQGETFAALRQFDEARAAADNALGDSLQTGTADWRNQKAITYQAEGDLAHAIERLVSISRSLERTGLLLAATPTNVGTQLCRHDPEATTAAGRARSHRPR